MFAGKSLLIFRVHTDDSSEAAVRVGLGTNADVVKAFGCIVVKVITASGTTALDTGTVISNTLD